MNEFLSEEESEDEEPLFLKEPSFEEQTSAYLAFQDHSVNVLKRKVEIFMRLFQHITCWIMVLYGIVIKDWKLIVIGLLLSIFISIGDEIQATKRQKGVK